MNNKYNTPKDHHGETELREREREGMTRSERGRERKKGKEVTQRNTHKKKKNIYKSMRRENQRNEHKTNQPTNSGKRQECDS